MAGTTVDYIIRLLRDDSDLKKQLKATERDISKLNAHERAEVKATLQARMDGLAAQAKAAKKSHSSGSIIDTSGLEDELKFIKEVFREMKSLNPAEDWAKSGKVFAQTFTNMHNQLSDLANSVETLRSSVTELGESFKNIGFNITPTVDMSGVIKQTDAAADGVVRVAQGFTIIGEQAGKAAVETNKAIEEMQKQLSSIDDLLDKNYNITIGANIDAEFEKAEKDIKSTLKQIKSLEKQMESMSVSDKDFSSTRDALLQKYVRVSELRRQQMLRNDRYAKDDPSYKADMVAANKELEDQILVTKQRVTDLIDDAKVQLRDIAKSNKTTRDGINIPIKLPTQADLIKTINKYIDGINESKAIHAIKIETDDPANVIEDKHKQGYKDNPADDDVNTTKLVEKTEARFQAVYDTIDKKQEQILEKTKEWRKNMADQLKFKNGDFEFNFGGDLFQSLQDYLNEQGNELKFVIDQETIKEQLKTIIENSGLTIGGLGGASTAVVDANAIAQAVYAGMQAAVSGQPLPSFDVAPTTKALEDAAESVTDIVNSSGKYVKTITEKTINSERVIEALRKFANDSTQKGAGRQNVAKWLTGKGIDIDAINKGASDDAIRAMLNEALMTKDKFGYASGSLFADALDDLKQFGITGGRQKTDVQNLKQEIVEMLSRMGINQEYWQESQRRYQSYESYENAAKYGRPIATLSKVRKPLYANSMKNFADGGYQRLTDNKYIGSLDSLVSLLDGLSSEHISKATQEIEELQQKALKLKSEFEDLDKESEDVKNRLDAATAEYDRLNAIPEDQLTKKDIANRIKAKKELDEAQKQYAWNRRDSQDKKKEYLRLVSYTDKDGNRHAGLIEQMQQREKAQHSVYSDVKKQILSFKDSILGLGENPSEEAINALEQVARNFFEQSGKMMQKLFSHYGDMDTFQGRVTLQNGRVVDISSPYDFLGINDGEVADVDVYNDILMKKWERSKSVKKGIPQDFERPGYYANRPKPPVDIENERIESQEFVPIDAEKTQDLTGAIKVAEYKVKQLSEENNNAVKEVEQLTSEIQTKEQEFERISGLVNSLSEAERQALTKEAEKAEKILVDRRNKQNIENQKIKEIDAKIYSTESEINSLQNAVTPEDVSARYDELDSRIYRLTQSNTGLESSKSSAYDAYEESLLNHEKAKKAYDDYIEKLVNQALQEKSKSGEIKKLAEEREISDLEAMGIIRKDLQREFNLSGRADIAELRKVETDARFILRDKKENYDRIAGQMDNNDKLITQLKQERDSLTADALQAERDVARQQKQVALQELQHQKKLAENRLKRAQNTEQSSTDVLANNVVLQQIEAERELRALRLKHGQLSDRVEETSAALTAEQTARERLGLQSQYNELKTQELKLQREIEQLEDGDTKNTKIAELEATIQKLSELETKIVSLGGTVNRVAQKQYTDEQKSGDALRQAEAIRNKLIEARAQQRAYASEIKDIEKLEENVRHGGLTSSIGIRYENKFKSDARSGFKRSEYYHSIRDQKKETLNQELDKFASEQARDIVAQIEKKKDDIRNQVVQKVLGKKNIDLNAIRKTAIDEYVKTDGYKKVVSDANTVRASRQADADNTFNREVNEYINNLVATEMAKKVTSSDIDKRAKDQNISVDDARKAIEQEIRRDVEQQYKEEIRQFRGQANIRKQEAYASAKIEEQKARSDARQYVGQAAVDKEIEKIAKDKASEIKRKQEASIKEFETSAEYSRMHETALNNVKQKQRELWDALDEEMKKLVDEYIVAIKADKGKVKITDDRFRSVFNDFIVSSESYSLSGQGEVDLKQYILDELAKRKAIAKGESDAGGKEKQEYIKGLPQLIANLEKSLDEALAYGGFEREELANSTLLQEIIDKTANLKSDEQELENKEKELTKAITELQDAQKQNKDTKPYKARVKELKAEIQTLEELIDREESEIENAKEQIALRVEEKAASSKSLSNRLADAEQRLAASKEKLANVKQEIADLEKVAKETETQHGKDSSEAERARLNLLYKQRAQKTLEKSISRDEKRVQRWSGKVAAEDVMVTTGEASTSTRGGIFSGVIAEMKEIANSMGAGATIDVDSSDIATETTLRAIFELLSGGGQASADLDAEKARGKAERDARRKEEQARVIAENKQKRTEQPTETSASGQSKSAKAKDKLSVEGQEYFKAITKAGSEYTKNTLKELDKQGILSEMGKQVQKLNGMTKGTTEYLTEQYKLAQTVFAYRSKLEAEGVTSHTRKKDGKKYLDNTAVAERDEVKALGDVKSLMISKVKDVADGLIKLGYEAKLGLNRPKDSTELDIGPVVETAEDVAQKLIEKFGKALPIEDLRTIVGKAASDLLISTGDPSRKVNRFDFYEQNYDAIVDKAFNEALIKRFKHLNGGKFTPDEEAEYDKILQLLTERGIYKGSKQEDAESEQQLENEKAKTAETQKQVENERKRGRKKAKTVDAIAQDSKQMDEIEASVEEGLQKYQDEQKKVVRTKMAQTVYDVSRGQIPVDEGLSRFIHGTNKASAKNIANTGLDFSAYDMLESMVMDDEAAFLHKDTRFATVLDIPKKYVQTYMRGVLTTVNKAFVKGYINAMTGEFVANSEFNPDYDLTGELQAKMQELQESEKNAPKRKRPGDASYGKKSSDIQLELDRIKAFEVSVEPEIASGAVAEEVEENVAETPAEAPVDTNVDDELDPQVKEQAYQMLQSMIGQLESFESRITELEGTDDPDAIAEKESLQKDVSELKENISNLSEMLGDEDGDSDDEERSDEDNQALLDAINNVGEKVTTDKTSEATSSIADSKSTEKTAAQGGLIGIMRTELAKESTLQKVLIALGEIAKKNALAGAGKQNSAQDLLEQFRRMLESDAWEGRERVAYLDLTTGSMSNSITGDDTSISAERLHILRTAYKDIMDLNAQVHTHANEEDPFFSKDDLNLFASDFADGITKQILLSKNNMTVLDMTDVKDVSGLLDALAKTEQNFEALATTASNFGAKYISRAFNEITPQGLVKMLGIKGIESKYTETETRESARQGVLAEEAKEAADMIQESTGRAIKKTVERVGVELETLTEKTDTKGNKTWTSQINNKFGKAMKATWNEISAQQLDNQFGVGTKASAALNEYREQYQKLTSLAEQFNNSTSEAEKDGLQKQINDLLPVFNKVEKELVDLIARKEQFLRIGEKLPDILNQDSIGKGSLEDIATREFFGNGLVVGQNIATAGTQSTKNGRQLLVDVLDHGTISRYGIEVDEVTGQVRKLTIAEGDLVNAFQSVNRAMRQNEVVQANVAIGESATEMQHFLESASSPIWDAYKASLQDMQVYTADLWNTMKAGGHVSQAELDYLMALSEKAMALGKNIQKTSIDFKNFWEQNPDNVFGIDKIRYNPDDRDEKVRGELEKRAKMYASASNSEYGFSSFDNDTLQFTLTDAEGRIKKVTYAWNELYQQIAILSDKSTSTIDPVVAKINKYDEALQQAVKDGYLMTEDGNFDAFYKATDGIRFLVGGIQQGYETFDTAKDKLYELRQEALKYGEEAKKTVAQNKRLFAGTGAKKSVDNQYNRIVGIRQTSGEDFQAQFADDSKLFKAYNDAYTQLNVDYQKYVDSHQLNDPKIQQQIQQEAAKVQTLGKRYLSSVTQAEKLKELVDQSGVYTDKKTGQEMALGGTTNVTTTEVANLKATMIDYVENGLKQANIEGVKFDSVNQKLTYTFRTSKNTVADMVVQYNDATSALYAYQKQERESLTGLPGFMHSMKAKMKSILQYTASITSIYRVFGELKRGIQYIKEIDSALTELKKVTDETEETYDRFLKTAAKTADKVGSTIKEIVSSTADWARLGYSLEQASTLAESTSVLLNVSEFQSIDEATSALTSTLQAFSYTAEQSMDVVDVLNEVGNNFAVSSDGIATALKDSASSLVAANNSYEEAVALVASANRVVQDPNSVGAALRTISLRLRSTSTKELEEAGEDTDGAITSTSKLQSKVKGLTGVDILTDTGSYRSTYDILLDISKVWKDMSDVDQAALLEIIAGKTRSNTAAAILSNTKDLEDALLAAQEAEGSALRENEKYLDSIQGRIDLFNNSVQTMWSNALDSGVVKAIVNLGTGLIKIVDNLGLINTLVFGLMSYLTVFKKDKLDLASILGIHDIENGWTFGKEGASGWIAKTFFPNKKKAIEQVAENMDDIGVAVQAKAEQMDMFSDEYDTQIQLNEKIQQLNTAKSELQSLNKTKWKDIEIPVDDITYTTSNRRRTYVNEVLIPNKEQEIAAIEKDIDDITKAAEAKVNKAQIDLKESVDGQLAFDFDAISQPRASSKYLDIFESGLGQGAEKFTYDTKQLGVELDKLNNMDNSGIIDYMASLDDLGDVGDDTKRVIASYASTVKDGNYTVQGAQQYVDQYNQKLKQTSVAATKARLAQAGLNLAISLATMALTALITKLIELATNAQKEFDKLSSQLSETESELKDINSQLDETKERIQELQEQGVLTFTDREELDRLRALNDELERQKQLTEQIKAQQQMGVNEAAIDAAEQYKKTGRNSGKTDGEKIGNGALIGVGVGGAAAGVALSAAGGAAALGTTLMGAGLVNGWNPVGWGLLAAGAIVAIGAAIGTGIGALAAAETNVSTTMENMREEHEKLQEKYEKKRQKFADKGGSGRRKRMEEASEELAEYESMMADHFAEMDQYYSSIDLSVYDEVKDADTIERLRTAMNEFYDTRDKWLIQSGGANAKSNAISRIFGENASQELKDIKKEIQDAMKAGEEFDFASSFDEDFKQRLYAMGLTVADVKYYFQELKKAEDEATEFSTEDAVKAVTNLADKVESLKGAFDEFNETGIVTAKTLVSLSETFGGLGDKWTDFVRIMTSGTSSTEEAKAAINDLIETLITSALSGEKIGTEQYVALWSQLTNLGVKNATEILDGIKEYSSIGEEIANEVINGEKTVEQAIADYEKANNVLLTEEQKQVVRATYNAKTAQQTANTYQTQADTLSTLTSEYERATEAEKEWESEVENAEDTKSGRFLGFLWKVQNDTDKERETNAILSEEAAQKNREAVEKQIEALYSQVFGSAGTTTDTNARILELQTFFAEPNNYDELSEEAQGALDELGDELGLNIDFEFEDPSKLVDDIQSVFDTLVDAQKEYKENGYLSVDTLQSLLQLEPKYLDLLVDEEGNLNLTKDAIYNVARARIIDMGVQSQKNILESATKLAMEGSSEALREEISVMEEASEAGTDFVTVQMAKVEAILAERVAAGELTQAEADAFVGGTMSQIEAVQVATQSALDNLSNSLSTSNNITKQETEDAFQKAMDYWDNRIEANQAKYDQIQNDIDWLESQGKMADANYYKDQIALMTEGEESKTAFLNNKLAEAEARMRELEAAGKEGSDEWWEAAQIYNDTLSELDDVRDTVLELQDAIGEIEWSAFEEFNSRLDDITSKLETMRDLIAPDGEEDWFDDEGNWTEKGVAVLGSYVQELEYYKNGLDQASDALDNFNEKSSYEGNEQWYADNYGVHSEQEYYDYLKKLTDEQYNYATSVSDTEQDIADMYESSIDAAEEYIETLVDSYNDYIDSVKEALDAERDLYNFKKNVKKQTKDIASLERRISALSGSTNAADIAERRKLEAQLAEQREELNDTYYEHSVDSQQEALDKEAQAYEEAMTKFIDNLRTNLDLALVDMEGFISGVTTAVTSNAPLILDEYDKLGIALDSTIVAPWQAAEDAMDGYTKEDGLGLMNSWIAEGGVFDTFATNATEYLTSIWDNANVDPEDAFSNAVVKKVEGIKESIKSNVETAKGYLNDLYDVKDSSETNTGGDGDNSKKNKGVTDSKGGTIDTDVERLQAILNQFFDAGLTVDGSYGPKTTAAVKKMQAKIGDTQDGLYVAATKKKLEAYLNKMPVSSWFKETGVYIPGALKTRASGGGGGGGAKVSHHLYAKGTLGTTRDEFAITDESWIGEEITLAAGKNGQLQYLKKGSAVMPADISANLVEWGKLNPHMMNMPGATPNINMISNAVNKPELNFAFDALVKAENITEETLPAVKKLVTQELNRFTKELNYALKGKGAR